MIWKGKELKKIGEIMEAIIAIDTKKEAAKFMKAYGDVSAHAKENIGYMTGYFNNETASRIKELFLVPHPIFGGDPPTPEQAFKTGKKLAGRRA